MSEREGPGKLPARTVGDAAYATAKAALSAIPGLGPFAAALWENVLAAPMEKRRSDWLEDLASRIAELERSRSEFDAARLQENEDFVTATVQASQMALRTHQEEKLQALRNAVLNVAAGLAPETDQQTMFFRFLDELTPTHMGLMRLLYETRFEIPGPESPPLGGQALASQLPGYVGEGRKSLYLQAARDLQDRGLVGAQDDFEALFENRALAIRQMKTNLGQQFLRFIEAPDETSDG